MTDALDGIEAIQAQQFPSAPNLSLVVLSDHLRGLQPLILNLAPEPEGHSESVAMLEELELAYNRLQERLLVVCVDLDPLHHVPGPIVSAMAAVRSSC